MIPDFTDVALSRLWSLEGRVAVVTGGGSGMGQATSLRLAEAGAAVAVADIVADKAKETVDLIGQRTPGALAVPLTVDVTGWERTAATWYPGSLLHQLGSVLAEAAGDGRIRCRCYASILALDAAAAAVLRGYLSYDDIWALDAGEWRLAYRETVMYGYHLSR